MKRIFVVIIALFLLTGCGVAAADWQEQYDLGIRYLSEQNYSEAILAFTAAIEVDPNRPELYIGRAQAYVASGETEENLAAALADYETAKELGYTEADLWLGMADIYIQREDYTTAQDVLNEASEQLSNTAAVKEKEEEVNSHLNQEETTSTSLYPSIPAANMIGKTVNEITAEYGTNYTLGSDGGSSCLVFSGVPELYLGDIYDKKEDIAGDVQVSSIRIPTNDRYWLIDNLYSDMTFSEISSALEDIIELNFPEYTDGIDGTMYSSVFEYKGYYFFLSWYDDPNTHAPSKILIKTTF